MKKLILFLFVPILMSCGYTVYTDWNGNSYRLPRNAPCPSLNEPVSAGEVTFEFYPTLYDPEWKPEEVYLHLYSESDNWNVEIERMAKREDASFALTLELEPGNYQFDFEIDNYSRWVFIGDLAGYFGPYNYFYHDSIIYNPWLIVE